MTTTVTLFCAIDATGTKIWSANGVLHCEDGPATECANGTKFWRLNRLLHRRIAQQLNTPMALTSGGKMASCTEQMVPQLNGQTGPGHGGLMTLGTIHLMVTAMRLE